MNALELADEVEMWGRDLLALNLKGGVPVIEGARLIRQQQAEIEALKLKYKQEFDYVEKKFSDEWWQGVAEYNKGKAQK